MHEVDLTRSGRPSRAGLRSISPSCREAAEVCRPASRPAGQSEELPPAGWTVFRAPAVRPWARPFDDCLQEGYDGPDLHGDRAADLLGPGPAPARGSTSCGWKGRDHRERLAHRERRRRTLTGEDRPAFRGRRHGRRSSISTKEDGHDPRDFLGAAAAPTTVSCCSTPGEFYILASKTGRRDSRVMEGPPKMTPIDPSVGDVPGALRRLSSTLASAPTRRTARAPRACSKGSAATRRPCHPGRTARPSPRPGLRAADRKSPTGSTATSGSHYQRQGLKAIQAFQESGAS